MLSTTSLMPSFLQVQKTLKRVKSLVHDQKEPVNDRKI